METTILENVELFKDRNFRKSWNFRFDVDGFKIELKDGKARAYSNQPFARPRSRYAKLHYMGCIGQENIFKFQVNGNQAFMRIKYTLK